PASTTRTSMLTGMREAGVQPRAVTTSPDVPKAVSDCNSPQRAVRAARAWGERREARSSRLVSGRCHERAAAAARPASGVMPGSAARTTGGAVFTFTRPVLKRDKYIARVEGEVSSVATKAESKRARVSALVLSGFSREPGSNAVVAHIAPLA